MAPGRRVLLVPMPLQGHINPLFKVGDLLLSRGFSITVLQTHVNPMDPAKYPHYDFATINPDEPTIKHNSMVGVVEMFLKLDYSLGDHFAKLLTEIKSSGEDVACVILDLQWKVLQDVAKNLGVATLILWTSHAMTCSTSLVYNQLIEKGYLPPQESRLDELVPDFTPFRVRDLLYVPECPFELLCQLVERTMEACRASSGVIMNSLDVLEGTELAKIHGKFPEPVFTIGPLHKIAPAVTVTSLLTEDRSCLDWLDTQAPGSVLYVSFGSLMAITPEELTEVAWGLAASGQPFLWVLRPNLVFGTDSVLLPDGFVEEVAGRARTVSWAPQLDVLAHPSVGGFWTHNGWNSTIEGAAEGVPMLCWPHGVDQMATARYIDTVWRIGIEYTGKLERSKISAAVKEVLVEKGPEMRKRGKEIRDKIKQSVAYGGATAVAVDQLVNRIQSF